MRRGWILLKTGRSDAFFAAPCLWRSMEWFRINGKSTLFYSGFSARSTGWITSIQTRWKRTECVSTLDFQLHDFGIPTGNAPIFGVPFASYSGRVPSPLPSYMHLDSHMPVHVQIRDTSSGLLKLRKWPIQAKTWRPPRLPCDGLMLTLKWQIWQIWQHWEIWAGKDKSRDK